jgi:hypothetical protein
MHTNCNDDLHIHIYICIHTLHIISMVCSVVSCHNPFADHYNLPSGLTLPMSSAVATAIKRLGMEGKEVFAVSYHSCFIVQSV